MAPFRASITAAKMAREGGNVRLTCNCGLVVLAFVVSIGLDKGLEFAALIIACVVVYFLPAIVAARRHHRNETAIIVVNLLGG